MGWKLGTLGEHIIQTSADLPETSYTNIFNTRENCNEARFPVFVVLYRKEGYARYGG